jgi:excisionase family DNA binding protein
MTAPARPCTELLPITEVARRLQVSRDTVERIVDRGELPVVDVGHGRAKSRIRCSDLEAWIAKRTRVIGRGDRLRSPA